jgi:hypothetical protein
MGDALKKVRSGQSLRIPAAAYNAFVDAATAHRNQQNLSTPGMPAPGMHAGLIRVKNVSGSAKPRFAVMGINYPVFSPTESLEAFQTEVAFDVTTPSVGHFGKIAILQEPLDANAIGRAAVIGPTAVKVNVTDEAHAYADLIAGDATKLASGHSGATILWRETGTREKWAVVNLSRPVPGAILFGQVQQIFLANGTAWTDWPTNQAYPAYCSARPCDSAGGNVQTSRTIYIGLNTNHLSPIGLITQGGGGYVIGYMTGDGKKTYTSTPITLAGQAVLGFGCWLDYARYR